MSRVPPRKSVGNTALMRIQSEHVAESRTRRFVVLSSCFERPGHTSSARIRDGIPGGPEFVSHVQDGAGTMRAGIRRTRTMKNKYKLCLAVALIAVAVLWASRRINSRSPDTSHLVVDVALAAPARVSAIISQHCGDCHSNATRWPWYAHIPPASWLLRRDVDHAKRVLNFSQPLAGQRDSASAIAMLSAICKMAKAGGMPPWRYRVLHPNSALNAADRAQLCQWTAAEVPRLEKIAFAEHSPAISRQARPNGGEATHRPSMAMPGLPNPTGPTPLAPNSANYQRGPGRGLWDAALPENAGFVGTDPVREREFCMVFDRADVAS